MKRKLSFLVAFTAVFIMSFVTAEPAAAYDGIQFDVKDDLTNQPWGTVDGQSYRIIIVDSTGIIFNSGDRTTPTNPPLNFTCDFGVACTELGGTIPTPAIGDVDIIITLDGTTADPTTITDDFEYFGDFGTPYTLNTFTGTGPTAISLNNFSLGTNNIGFAASFGIALVLMTITGVILIRRHTSPAYIE